MTAPFASITSEGGLLPPDLLARIALLDKTVPGLSAADYRLDDGQRIGEAISRSWNRMLPTWRAFRTELALLPADDPATTLTRERFLQPLLDELKYGRVPTARAIEIDGRTYAISHNWGNVPIHLLGARVSLEARTVGQVGAAKSSPHGLVQDLLNRSEPHLWALVSNGLVLRLLRDHHSLTTQAYVEVDLESLFEGERYADFALLWLVFHQSRVDPRGETNSNCWLERWFALSRDEGLSALDELRDGVVKAIEKLGIGFLKHSRNKALHRDLEEGALDRQEFYRELLRLAYRLIFLFSAEDREVLNDPGATEVARARYRRFYATRRLRDLAGVSRGGAHGDLWQGLRTVMSALDDGCSPLALPALGSFLWSRFAVRHLERCELANSDLLAAVQELSYLRRHGQRFPVSWRTVAADELGSIYESLLELHPQLDARAGVFELVAAIGSERKKTGSYYTPTALVECVLDNALDPVVNAAIKGKPRMDAEQALLSLRVVDPACGSGHFLVAAARRIARRLAGVRTGDSEPSPPEFRRALRDVVGRCIYGVDLNEMAVELCKVALWMEALEPGKPLSFLDAHIRHGNALIGAAPVLMDSGIPDDAWTMVEGDDPTTARELKRRNSAARADLAKKAPLLMTELLLPTDKKDATLSAIQDAAQRALAGEDETVFDIRALAIRWAEFEASQSFRELTFISDLWCAAFIWRKRPGELAACAPTQEIFEHVRKAPSTAPVLMTREVNAVTQRYAFFHWHLAFPEVFSSKREGDTLGFDVVLGNPPWETADLMRVEFFASLLPDVARASTDQRERLIDQAIGADPVLNERWQQVIRESDGANHFVKKSGRYPLTCGGKLNTYRSFAELATQLVSPTGAVGMILKSGIINAQDNQAFFESLTSSGRLIAAFDFINTRPIFAGVVANERFCVLALSGGGRRIEAACLAFCLNDVAQVDDPARRIVFSVNDLPKLNPNDRSVPPLTSSRDKDIVLPIHNRVPVLVDESRAENRFSVKYARGHLNSSTDSKLFSDNTYERLLRDGLITPTGVPRGGEVVPLVEGKLIGSWNHRFGTFLGVDARVRFGKKAEANEPEAEDLRNPQYESVPRYWLKESSARKLLAGKTCGTGWLLTFRHVCRAVVDARTAQVCVSPAHPSSDSCALLLFGGSEDVASATTGAICVLASWNSLVGDYVVRQKQYGPALTKAIALQLPVVDPTLIPSFVATDGLAFLRERVLELTYTSGSLTPFARDCGYDGPPFQYDEQRRGRIRSELDAAMFHAFGVSQGDADYIIEQFPIVRRRDVQAYGTYRTKDNVLAAYGAMAAARDIGKQFRSDLFNGSNAMVFAREVPTAKAARKVLDGAFATPDDVSEGDLALFALIEVLRLAATPIDPQRVRLASILVRKPAMAVPLMDDATGREWSRLIGPEALPLPGNVIDISQFKKNAIDHPWRAAVTQLTGARALVQEADLWSASGNLPPSKQPWVAGRAEMAVRLVRELKLPKVEKQIALFLKDVKRGATAQTLIS